MELEAWKVDETQPETGDQTNKCIKIYRINPFHFSWAMEIAALKQSAFLHTCLFNNEIVPIYANSEGAMASWHYYIGLSMDWWTCPRMVGGRTAER